jgi:hypothetical protein
VAVADSTYASLRLLERCRKVFNPINFTMIVLYATFSVRWDLQIALVFALLILFAGTIAYFKGALSRNIVIGAMVFAWDFLETYFFRRPGDKDGLRCCIHNARRHR